MAARKTGIKKIKQETSEWSELFMNNLKTKDESLVFVERMMVVAVSSITYLRGIFPEDAYRSRYLEDLCIKVLREDCTITGASKVVKWIMGCFDALEKQYLQIVFIGVYTNPDEPDCIIESYQFKFKYSEKGPQVDILRNNDVKVQVTLEDTKRASVLLVRKLSLLMQNMNALPNNVYLTMKLYYYDDITPADYEPPGFKEGERDNVYFAGKAVLFTLGEVNTNFHSFKVRVSAEQDRLEKIQEGNRAKEAKQVLQRDPSQRETFKLQDPHNDEEDLPSEDESAQFMKPARPAAKKRAAAKNPARKKRRI